MLLHWILSRRRLLPNKYVAFQKGAAAQETTTTWENISKNIRKTLGKQEHFAQGTMARQKRKRSMSPPPATTATTATTASSQAPARRFYDILGVEHTATQAQIEKAYKTIALKVHPDKNKSDTNATELFQQLQLAYTTLKDPLKRKFYDQNGCEDDETAAFMEAYEHYRLLFPQLQAEDVQEYAKSYKGSEDEKQDLIDYYKRFNGDIKDLLEWIPLSEADDIPRYITIFDKLIKEKVLPPKKSFKTSSIALKNSKKKWKQKEEREKKEFDAGSKSDLSQLMLDIQNNQRKRSATMTKLFHAIEEADAKKRKKAKNSRH